MLPALLFVGQFVQLARASPMSNDINALTHECGGRPRLMHHCTDRLRPLHRVDQADARGSSTPLADLADRLWGAGAGLPSRPDQDNKPRYALPQS